MRVGMVLAIGAVRVAGWWFTDQVRTLESCGQEEALWLVLLLFWLPTLFMRSSFGKVAWFGGTYGGAVAICREVAELLEDLVSHRSIRVTRVGARPSVHSRLTGV